MSALLAGRLHGGAAAFRRSTTRASVALGASSLSTARNLTPGSSTPLRECGGLRLEDLETHMQLSELSGIAYSPPADIERLLNQQGARLVAQGRNDTGPWFVADACDGMAHARSNIRAGDRLVVVRGVVWRDSETDVIKLNRNLMNVWPRAFPTPASDLVAHSGIASIAEEIWTELRPHLQDPKQRVFFAGHSLGGSLAKLLLCATRLDSPARPSSHLSCVTLGSPPCLGHRMSFQTPSWEAITSAALATMGVAGSAPVLPPSVLGALDLPDDCVTNYVVDNDPIPRAMLAVDPAFTALKNTPLRSLLELRSSLLGDTAVLSPNKFLWDCVGLVLLLRHTPEAGVGVTRVDPGNVHEDLKTAEVRMFSAEWLKAMSDHHHRSYTQELASLLVTAQRAAARR